MRAHSHPHSSSSASPKPQPQAAPTPPPGSYVVAARGCRGLLNELTGGHEFKNCEIKSYTLSESGRMQQMNMFSAMFR